MTFISTFKLKAKHKLTPRDIYFNNLEEAYGNLPVPSDDYADIKELMSNYYFDKKLGTKDYCNEIAQKEIDDLEDAIKTICDHYDFVAKLLDKKQLYG